MKNKILIFCIILLAQASCKDQNVRNTDYKGEEGLLEWQFPDKDKELAWKNYSYSIERWWGDFPKDIKVPENIFESYKWAIGPFTKYEYNPVLEPSPGRWDKGRYGGGVHNGSVIVKDSLFYYVYRGEQPIDIKLKSPIDYIGDIGVATSKDGIHFEKDTIHSPFFRKGENRKYSYEDVNIVLKDGTYYLYCNQWFWQDLQDHTQNGICLATSKNLLDWNLKGIVFPNVKRTHRDGIVLANPKNEAVKVNGKYVMYINDRLIAYSDDLIKWESHENPNKWPGGEPCFAVCDYDASDPDNIILFTGGNHTGHFYAIGEVLLSKKDPAKPIEYLPAPVLKANPHYPYENGFTSRAPFKPISSFSDCIFLDGITMHNGKWWVYYGGSEYYTCLATSNNKN